VRAHGVAQAETRGYGAAEEICGHDWRIHSTSDISFSTVHWMASCCPMHCAAGAQKRWRSSSVGGEEVTWPGYASRPI
jgi:hypothetical protein